MRFLFVFLLGAICCFGFIVASYAQGRYRAVAYNVENLYDTENDPKTADDEFTPKGRNKWSITRYKDKLLKLSRTIEATGGGELPAFIGLSEIENRKVVDDLISKTGLSDGNYAVVHKDSPDKRGIDVAFLYRKASFQLLQERFIRVPGKEKNTLYTRDILYASGILAGKDTLHFFVCHFPSMSGGEAASEWKRIHAASLVKQHVDSIQHVSAHAAIIILGDLNGKADRQAQREVLGVQASDQRKWNEQVLYHTGYYLLNKNYGSYKYQGEWQTIDHIIVTGSLLNKKHAIYTDKRLTVFRPDFLQEEDKKYFGTKPFRTYLGPRYHGGYSDHLPVYLDIYVK